VTLSSSGRHIKRGMFSGLAVEWEATGGILRFLVSAQRGSGLRGKILKITMF
jgi:hypothetical protein